MKISPTFLFCPICQIEYIYRFLKDKIRCPNCDFSGNNDQFLSDRICDFEISKHPLEKLPLRKYRMIFTDIDYYFIPID